MTKDAPNDTPDASKSLDSTSDSSKILDSTPGISKPLGSTPNELQPREANQENTTAPSPSAASGATGSLLHESRSELLSRARSFLQSPQIRYQDLEAKRRFLMEKGLNDFDINTLLQEVPPQTPAIPPRTYPQPPPSNLPNLLLGLVRLFSWIAGGSAALIFIYYRILLPRITQSSLARHSLKTHHLSLLRKLTTSLASLKESQAESLSILPHAEPHKEPAKFSTCNSVSDILRTLGDKEPDFSTIPLITLLRCGITDFGKGKDTLDAKPTSEDLFRFLEGQIPWLVSEDGLKFEQEIWETLSTCPLFTGEPPLPSPTTSVEMITTPQIPTRWTYTAPEAAAPSSLVKSLDALSASLPRAPKVAKTSPFQHTLQSLSDFTGYVSTQVYLPYRLPSSGLGSSGNKSDNPVKEELQREIRALKGLVLNRRSFMPTIPRPATALQLPNP